MDEETNIVIEFLYLSRERYQFEPEEVYRNFKKLKVQPNCVAAIQTRFSGHKNGGGARAGDLGC